MENVFSKRGLRRDQIAENRKPALVHGDIKLEEMKGGKVKIYGKNGECNYYVCCIDLRGLHCPQIEMAFTCLGPSLTKTLSLLLTRPCCHGNAGLDTGAKARFDKAGLMDVFSQHSQFLSSYFLQSRLVHFFYLLPLDEKISL